MRVGSLDVELSTCSQPIFSDHCVSTQHVHQLPFVFRCSEQSLPFLSGDRLGDKHTLHCFITPTVLKSSNKRDPLDSIQAFRRILQIGSLRATGQASNTHETKNFRRRNLRVAILLAIFSYPPDNCDLVLCLLLV